MYLFRLIAILLIISYFVTANDEKVTFYVPGIKSDTIDFGMRYNTEDVIGKTFYFTNNTNKTYYIGETAPTYATFVGPSGNATHGAFEKPIEDDRIIEIAPGETETRTILFSPFDLGDDVENQIGMYDAYFEIGVSEDPNDLSNPEKIDFKKRFLLIGRSSDRYFDIWEKKINFDSVFVRSPNKVEKELNFRNNSEDLEISLDSIKLEVITSQPAEKEFILEELSLPIDLQARSANPGNDQESVRLQYKPINRGLDSAYVNFYSSVNNSFTQSSATVSGFGVVQELSIIDCSENFFIDDGKFVIDLGEIDIGESVALNGTILNTGNLNFKAISSSVDGEELNGDVQFSGRNDFALEINEDIDFSATFTPNSRGFLKSEILIESDASKRNIQGFVEALHRYERIEIRANSIEPVLTTGIIDTLDFGVISGTEDCLGASTKEFKIKNTGTGVLEIINAFTSDLAIFDIEIDTNFVDPGEEVSARINFLPDGDNLFRQYDKENLFLISNMRDPNDTIKIPLKATYASPGETELFLEDVSFFPGTRLKIPVLVNGERITLADRFSSTLTFEKTLLRFVDINTLETASELAANTSFSELIEGGVISVNINIPQGETFRNNDTLCFFEFDTFIGKKQESNMVFVDPKFGDEDCSSLISINSGVGLAQIDSLCYLDQIVHDNDFIVISNIYPNPADDFIELDIRNENNIAGTIKISITNIFGEEIISDKKNIEHIQELRYDIEYLPNGIYNVLIQRNNQITNRKFIKN